jgi:hypothetical protein
LDRPATGELRYRIEGASAFDRYVVDFVAEVLGLRPVEVPEAGDTRVLVWGGGPSSGTPGDGGIFVPRRDDDVIWADLLHGRLGPDDVPVEVPFDVLGAIGRLLTDKVNDGLPADTRDAHGRLKFASSFQATAGYGDLPIVNAYVDVLRSLVARQFGETGVPLWPGGAKAAIGLSHDVDRPYKWGILRAFGRVQWPFNPLRFGFFAVKVGKTAVDRIRLGGLDDFWLFDQIMAAERERGFKSTFMFASTPSFGRGGTRYDVDYDTRWPRFRPVFSAMNGSNFEVGLHASYGAFAAPIRFTNERQRLAARSGAEVTGLRHHFWHLGPDEAGTLQMHEEAGFAYDSSLAFNDDLGFRRNVALPFQPWDDILGRPIKTVQLPTFCMDGNLFYRGSTPEAAVKRVADYVAQLKKYGGLGVIDWHVRTSIPANRESRDWGKAYLGILDLLAADRELWVANLGEIERQVRTRRTSLWASPSGVRE